MNYALTLVATCPTDDFAIVVVVPPRSPVQHFETLPIAYSERTDYRVVVIAGALVAAAVVGQLVANETIVLLGIELDLDCPDERPH